MSVQHGDTQPLELCPACGRANASDARFCANCGLALGSKEPLLAETVADPLVGRIIADRYKIISLIGRGGMGVVYKIEHVHIGKLMAMKLLHGELARDKDTAKRFKREAEAASQLNHPNTVQIFDFGRDQGLTYIVMEYLDGYDFGWLIQHESPVPFARVARICAQVCGSVAQAHTAGIIHRDLKPENIMVIQGGERPDLVKVLDFGLAKLRHTDTGHSITRAGSIIGTPYYMAPEHIRGEEVDGRSDIYSLGALMYKAIAGVPPFWAATPMGVLTKHLTDDLVPPRERVNQRDIPPEADAIIMKAMAKNPADRYAGMRDLQHDLVSYLASVGESFTDSTLNFPTGASLTSKSGRRQVVQVATRGDVDFYERRIKRKGWVGGLLIALAMLALAGGAAYAVNEAEPRLERAAEEHEPNHTPDLANALPRAFEVRGHIGQRQSEAQGDTDVYVIDNPGGDRRFIRIDVEGVRNMDLAVDIIKAGIERPALVADSASTGASERIPNFPLSGTTYYVRVREVRVAGMWPTENISDTYSIEWDYVELEAEDEHEVNDSLELAEEIVAGGLRRGYIGWAGDVDTYCLSEDAPAIVAELTGVESLDLVLRVVDRATASSQRVDVGEPGQGERSRVISPARAQQTCFEISADTRESGGGAADPDEAYVLRIAAAEPPAP